MNGLALTIIIGQLPKLFGFSIDAKGLIAEAKGFVQGVSDGQTVPAALAVGVGCLLLILVFQRFLPRLPGVLVAVVLAIVTVNLLNLGDHGVKLVGVLPQGVPPFTVPLVPIRDLGLLAAGALGIALVSLTDTISTASAFAAREGARIDGDREMIGIGAANIAAGFFQGFPVSTSGSRTAVAVQNGAKTQVTNLVGAAAILLILLFAPGLLKNLPQPTLAAVVIAASLSLADIKGMRRLWRQRKSDFTLALAAFLGVALLGVLPGIGLAVGLSILDVFRRAWRPYETQLGRVSGLSGYHDIRIHPDADHLPGLVIYRFDSPLLFANANTFRDRVLQTVDDTPDLRWIVVAAEPITDIDTTAADMLAELGRTLDASGVSLVFAELKTATRRKAERYELTKIIGPAHFFPTIGAAVRTFQSETGAEWAAPETEASTS
jgi:MFS superfamily sulfate permease-like transporter